MQERTGWGNSFLGLFFFCQGLAAFPVVSTALQATNPISINCNVKGLKCAWERRSNLL